MFDWEPIDTAAAEQRALFATPVGVLSGKKIEGKLACYGLEYRYMPATHWMPLPDGPEAANG